MELAVSRMISGERIAGFFNMVGAVIDDPAQLFRVAHLGRRRLRRLVVPA